MAIAGASEVVLRAVGPCGARIRPISGADGPGLAALAVVFTAIFPHYAHYVPYLRICALQQSSEHPHTLDHVWAVEVEGRWIGVRVFRYLYRRNFGLDAFIGLLPAYRGNGISAWLVAQTLAQLGHDAACMERPPPLGSCAEIEVPALAADAGDRLAREQRLAFYRGCGGIVLDVDYLEPPGLAGVSYMPEPVAPAAPQPMLLVFCPTRPRTSISREETLSIVEGLYVDAYYENPATGYVAHVLASPRPRGGL